MQWQVWITCNKKLQKFMLNFAFWSHLEGTDFLSFWKSYVMEVILMGSHFLENCTQKLEKLPKVLILKEFVQKNYDDLCNTHIKLENKSSRPLHK